MNAQGLRNGGDDLGSIAAAIAYTLRSSAEVLPQTAGKLHPLAERFAELGATTSKVPAEFVSGLRNLLVEASDTLARERASVMGAAADVLAALGKRVDVVLAATTKWSAEGFKGAVVDTAGGAAQRAHQHALAQPRHGALQAPGVERLHRPGDRLHHRAQRERAESLARERRDAHADGQALRPDAPGPRQTAPGDALRLERQAGAADR